NPKVIVEIKAIKSKTSVGATIITISETLPVTIVASWGIRLDFVKCPDNSKIIIDHLIMGLRHRLLTRDFKLSPHLLLSFHQCRQTILVLARHKMLAITMIIVLTLIMARPLYIRHQCSKTIQSVHTRTPHLLPMNLITHLSHALTC